MSRLYLLAGILFMLVACNTQQMICPAYQSSFIYDKEVAKQKFSYFQADTTPKMYTASKNKYLVAVPESYRKKYRRLQTVEMTPVYPVIADSLKQQDEFQFAEMDSTDSVAMAGRTELGDSVYAITKTKEKYNLDQDLYMWYFREVLVLPDVRAAIEKKTEQEAEAKAGPVKKEEKKKGIKGFFQNLFKKKPKKDPAATDPSATGVNAPPKPEEEKGGLFKKKKKTEPAPAKKTGDGF